MSRYATQPSNTEPTERNRLPSHSFFNRIVKRPADCGRTPDFPPLPERGDRQVVDGTTKLNEFFRKSDFSSFAEYPRQEPPKMKFRFLGDGDCPDWLLAEINTLSRMTSIKIKILGQTVAKYLAEGELDEEKVKKITQDAKVELNDAKAMVAALELIFTSSARYGVTAADLSSELQQLGLPREHSATLARLHTDHSPQITVALSSHSLRVSRLSSIEVSACDSSSPFSAVSLQLKKLDGSGEHSIVNISKDDAHVLLTELRRAKSLMEYL